MPSLWQVGAGCISLSSHQHEGSAPGPGPCPKPSIVMGYLSLATHFCGKGTIS